MIVFVGPGVGHFTNLVLPGEGIFESFFARRGDEFDCRLDGLMLMSLVLLQRLLIKMAEFSFGDIFIVPFLGPALGWTGNVQPGLGKFGCN